MPILKPLLLTAATTLLLAAATIAAPGVLAEDVCRTYRKGNKIITEYCPGHWKCAGDNYCTLPPQAKKMLTDFVKGLKSAQQMHLKQAERYKAQAKIFGQSGRRHARKEQVKRPSGYGRCPQPLPNFDCSCPPTPVTAAWHAVCRPNVVTDRTPRYRYRSDIIPPQALYQRALQGCRDVAWIDRDSCVTAGKVQILLSLDSAISAACGSLSEKALTACVDGYYVDTSDESPYALRERIKRALSDKTDPIDDALSGQMPPGY